MATKTGMMGTSYILMSDLKNLVKGRVNIPNIQQQVEIKRKKGIEVKENSQKTL